MSLAEKITDSELEVMKVLWDAEHDLPVSVIREKLQESMGWEATTIKTLVGRLVTKGVISQKKYGVYFYAPLIAREEYNRWATESLIHRLYKGSAKNLVAALVNSDGLTRDDLKELREMFVVEE